MAALFLYLERAACSPAKMRAPAVLLTTLWVLESYSSQYRSSASVVLADYLNFEGGLLRSNGGGILHAGAGCASSLDWLPAAC